MGYRDSAHSRIASPTEEDHALSLDEDWDHLPYSLLEGWVDETLDPNDREIVAGHIAACTHCAAALEDLAQYRTNLAVAAPTLPEFVPGASPGKEASTSSAPTDTTPEPEAPRHIPVWRPLWGGALGGFALGAAALLTLYYGRVTPLERELDAQRREVTLLTAQVAASKATPTPMASPTVDPALREQVTHLLSENRQLRDRLAKIESQTRDGAEPASPPPVRPSVPIPPRRLPAPLPPESVRLAFAEGRLRLPDLSTLGGGAGETRGGGDEGATESFRLLSPVATWVETARPVFSWTPLPGAARYSVIVADADDHIVAQHTGNDGAVRWQADRSLPRGVVLTWEVHAYNTAGVEIASVGGVFFSVLSSQAANSYTEDRRRTVNDSLAVTVVQASAGLWEEADEGLRRLIDTSKDTQVRERARVFLEQLTAERQRLRPGAGERATP